MENTSPKATERITFTWREDQNPEIDTPMRARWTESGNDIDAVRWFDHVDFSTQSYPTIKLNGDVEFSYVAEEL